MSESEISYRIALSGIYRKLEFYKLAAMTRSTRSRTYKGSKVIINEVSCILSSHKYRELKKLMEFSVSQLAILTSAEKSPVK